MVQAVDVNDPNVQHAVCVRFWNRARPSPGAESRSLTYKNPADLIRELVQELGMSIGRSGAGKLLGKLRDRLELKWVSGTCLITCLVDPTRQVSPKPIRRERGPSTSSVPAVLRPLDADKAYRFLYQRHGKTAGVSGPIRHVTDPDRRLRNKFGPNKDTAASIAEMEARKWAEWREVQPGQTQRLYLLVDSSAVSSGEVQTSPPHAEIEEKGEAMAMVAMTVSHRRDHGQMGVYMTTLDQQVWEQFVQGAPEQASRGWDLGLAPRMTREALCRAVGRSDTPQEDVLEVVGRMCAANLLRCVDHGVYCLAWNPRDVIVKTTARRIIEAPKERLDQIEAARTVACRLTNADGTIDSARFWAEVAEKWGGGTKEAGLLLLDYDSEEAARSGKSLRVLVRPSVGGSTLLLAPEALAGCDFFPLPSGLRRSRLVGHEDSYCVRYIEMLRRRYHRAAEFRDGERVEEVAVASVLSRDGAGEVQRVVLQSEPEPEPKLEPESSEVEAAPARVGSVHVPSVVSEADASVADQVLVPVVVPEPLVPAPYAAVEARAPSLPQERVQSMRRECEGLRAHMGEHARAEEDARAKAADLRRQAEDLDRRAEEFVRRRVSVERELEALEARLASLEEIEQQLATLLAKRDRLLG